MSDNSQMEFEIPSWEEMAMAEMSRGRMAKADVMKSIASPEMKAYLQALQAAGGDASKVDPEIVAAMRAAYKADADKWGDEKRQFRHAANSEGHIDGLRDGQAVGRMPVESRFGTLHQNMKDQLIDESIDAQNDAEARKDYSAAVPEGLDKEDPTDMELAKLAVGNRVARVQNRQNTDYMAALNDENYEQGLQDGFNTGYHHEMKQREQQ